ncbi:interleukin-17 receptor E-like isoform X2 [Rhinoraja longicauda]
MDSLSRLLFTLFLTGIALSGGTSDVRTISKLSAFAFGDPGGKQEQLDIENWIYRNQVKAPEGYSLNFSRLLISTVRFCPSSRCKSCVRVSAKLNYTAPVKIEGVQISFFKYNNNRNEKIQIRWKERVVPVNAAHFVFECFVSDGGGEVEVTVNTVPDYGPQLTAKYIVEDLEQGPQIRYVVVPEKQQIVVTVDPGHTVHVVLCYKRGLWCPKLKKHPYQLINTTSTFSYDYLLPCLCIEAFYPGSDSHRTTVCPFTDAPEAFGPDLWRSSNFSDLAQRKNNMAVRYLGKCLIAPEAVLCWKSNGSCVEFAESAAKYLRTGYVFESVDKHSQMCFKFKHKNSSHVECRNKPDTDWNVTMETESNKLVLAFASHFPASFSAVLCKPVGDECKNASQIYSKHQTELSSQKLLMILPVKSLKLCVKVWRSDVTFSGKKLLCPHYPLWSRTVLLMYSPDSEEHKSLVCTFADILKTELECNVILDLWDSGSVAEIGIVSWLYSKRELVETEGGKIVIIWSGKSQEMYREWNMLEPVSKLDHDDLHDLFNTSMACIYNDILGNRNVGDYSIIYFRGQCGKKNIPDMFAEIPKYQMLKDFTSFVRQLQSAVDLTCSFRLSTKYLVHKILKSEKMQRLMRSVEQSRKLQDQKSLC